MLGLENSSDELSKRKADAPPIYAEPVKDEESPELLR